MSGSKMSPRFKRGLSVVGVLALIGGSLTAVSPYLASAATPPDNATIAAPITPKIVGAQSYSLYPDDADNFYDTLAESSDATLEHALAAPGTYVSTSQKTAYILPGDTMTWGLTIVNSQSAVEPIKSGTAFALDDNVGWYMPGVDGLWSPKLTDSNGVELFGLGGLGDQKSIMEDATPARFADVSQSTDCASGVWTYDAQAAAGQWMTLQETQFGEATVPVVDGQQVSEGRDPIVAGQVLWNAWCRGPLTVEVVWNPEAATPVEAQGDGLLPVLGYSGAVQASEEGLAVYESADGTAWDGTFSGSNNRDTGFASTSSFTASALAPELQLIKQVCTTYNTAGQPTCTNDSEAGWVADTTYGDDNGATGVANGGVSAGVEQGLVPEGVTTILWRLTAHNSGNLALANVVVAEDLTNIETPDGSVVEVETNGCLGQTVADRLEPNQSTSITCTTQLASGFTGVVQNTAALNGAFDDATTPIFTSPDGTPVRDRFAGYGENGAGLVPSNIDSAQVTVPEPGIKLTKWVCQHAMGSGAVVATGCADPTADQLAIMAGYDTADGVSQGQPAGEWAKEGTTSYGGDAEWLVVVTNTGNTYLQNVTINDVVSGEGAGTTSAPQPTSIASLAPGTSGFFRLMTDQITNTAEFVVGDDGQISEEFGEPTYNVGADVVNVATASGTPVADDSGTPLPSQGDTPTPPITSNQSNAEVNTEEPNPVIGIEKFNTSDGEGLISGDYDDTVKPLDPDELTPLTLQITNTGNEDLLGVVVSDETTKGDVRITDLSCDFSQAAAGAPTSGTTWDGPFRVGTSFTCTGLLPALAANDPHQDKAIVSGYSILSQVQVADQDVWNGQVVTPGSPVTPPSSPTLVAPFPTGGVVAAGSGGSGLIPWLLAGTGLGLVGWLLRRRAA